MEFGPFVPCHRFDDRVSVAELYDQALEPVRLADDAGFTTAWFPEHHLEKVRAYEQLGVDQFILYGAFGPDHAGTMASLRRFAEDVMPHFAKGSRA